jgi:hypothetical protein
MALDQITSQAIASGAVTSDAIASGAVTVTGIPDGEITAAKLHTTAISDKLGYTPVSPTTLASELATKANVSSLAAVATSGSYNDLSNKPSTGKVLQVISSSTSTQASTTSLDWQNSNLAVTITPSSTSSRILVLVNDRGRNETPGNYHECWFEYGLFKDGVSTALSEIVVGWGSSPTTYGKLAYENLNLSYIDSPNTTSAVTYRTKFKQDINGAGTPSYVHQNATYSGSIEGVCQIIAMEIAG